MTSLSNALVHYAVYLLKEQQTLCHAVEEKESTTGSWDEVESMLPACN